MGRTIWLVVWLSSALGCRQLLGLDDRSFVDASGVADAFVMDAFVLLPDGGVCQGVGAFCADPTVLRTCSAVGDAPTDTACSWGCAESQPNSGRCESLVPSGGGVVPGDLDPDPGLTPVTIAATATLDGDTGAITGVPSDAFKYHVANHIAVFTFDSLTVTAPLAITGSLPVALVAASGITISAPIDVRGTCTGTSAGPGGFAGGAAQVAGTGSGGGGGGSGLGDPSAAGGGGGHGAVGGVGGSSPHAPGGGAFGDDTIAVLVGGGGGGGGGPSSSGGGTGGGGGGALQLVANGVIAFTSGGINAGGCGGKLSYYSGGGGGAGGTILIEATAVQLGAGVVLAVNGGGGGGGGGSGAGATDGSAGAPAATPSAGGKAGHMGAHQGGPGGAGGARGALLGGAGGDDENGGGGGGAVGRIRIDTPSGAATIDPTAVLSPSLTDVMSSATQGTTQTQ